MGKVITDRLVDEILEVVLEDMDCHHVVEHDQFRTQTSVEYNLQNELKIRNKIIALLKPKITKGWIEKKAEELHYKLFGEHDDWKNSRDIENFIRSLVEEVRNV